MLAVLLTATVPGLLGGFLGRLLRGAARGAVPGTRGLALWGVLPRVGAHPQLRDPLRVGSSLSPGVKLVTWTSCHQSVF
jgi:hypothetical protein